MTIAYKLKNAINIGLAGTAVYTVPASTTALVNSLIIANRAGVDITVDVLITDTSAVVQSYLVRGAPIPPNSSIIPLGDNNKQALETTDVITVIASINSACDATLSVMEETA